MGILIKSLYMIYRYEIYKSYLKQKKIRKLSLEEIQKIQWTRLKKLLDYVYDSSDFYRECFETVNLKPQDIKSYKDFTKLPIVNKKILKNNYKKIITKGSSIKNYTVSCTAGSTGEPFPFLLDKKIEHPSTTAAYMLSKENIDIDPFKKYNELMIKANPTNEIKLNEPIRRGILHKLKYQFISETFGIKSSEIIKDNTEAIYSIIKNNNIKGIYGYSSNIFYLAKLFKMHNFRVELKYIILIAEGLLKQQKNLIMNVFNCPVYMDYGSSECMRMGFECNQFNGYHMDIYNYYFEYLNNNNQTCRPGSIANIVVTNLNNYIFPLVRYKVGDQCIAPKDDKCSCGLNYPLVNQIIGRDSDSIITPLNEEISRNDFTVCLTYLYEYIDQYQIIVDRNLNTIYVKIIPTEKFTSKTSEQIKEDILKLIKYSMDVKIELVEKIPFEKHGKTKELIIK